MLKPFLVAFQQKKKTLSKDVEKTEIVAAT